MKSIPTDVSSYFVDENDDLSIPQGVKTYTTVTTTPADLETTAIDTEDTKETTNEFLKGIFSLTEIEDNQMTEALIYGFASAITILLLAVCAFFGATYYKKSTLVRTKGIQYSYFLGTENNNNESESFSSSSDSVISELDPSDCLDEYDIVEKQKSCSLCLGKGTVDVGGNQQQCSYCSGLGFMLVKNV